MGSPVKPRPNLNRRQVERVIDPKCPFTGFCGDPIDGRLCDTCMTPEERGPEPNYTQHRITQPCRPCVACGEEFVAQDHAKGVEGDLVWVTGEKHAGYKRYHADCLPASK